MKQFVKLTDAEFDQFSRNYPQPSFLQSSAMARSQTERGQTVLAYGIKDGDQVVAAALFTIRPIRKIFRIATAQGGLLTNYSSKEDLAIWRDGLIKEFGKQGIVQVTFLPTFTLQERDLNGELVVGGEDHHDWVDNLLTTGFGHTGYHNHYGTMDSRWFFIKDMRPFQTEDELIQSFDTQNRWATRKTHKLGITVRELAVTEIERFLELMEHTSERRGFEMRDVGYFQSILKQFNQADEAKILVAELDLNRHQQELLYLKEEQVAELAEATARHQDRPTKKMANRIRVAEEAIAGFDDKLAQLETMRPDGPVILLAGALFIRFGNTLSYLFSGAYDKYLHFNAPYAIQWEAMTWAMRTKSSYYDFLNTVGRFAGHDDEGVYHFKKGFDGQVVERPGTFTLITKPLLGKLFTRLTGQG